MSRELNENLFQDPRAAAEWVQLIESEKARVRELDVYPKLNARLARVGAREVLEIGAGQGACGAALDVEARRYTGVEPVASLRARADERCSGERRRFVDGDAYALPFAAGAFDAVFTVMLWHLLSELTQAARETARVLQPGGALLVILPHPEAEPLWTAPYTDGVKVGKRFEGTLTFTDGPLFRETLFLHTLADLTGALAATGFTQVALDPFRAQPDGQCKLLAIEATKTG